MKHPNEVWNMLPEGVKSYISTVVAGAVLGGATAALYKITSHLQAQNTPPQQQQRGREDWAQRYEPKYNPHHKRYGGRA